MYKQRKKLLWRTPKNMGILILTAPIGLILERTSIIVVTVLVIMGGYTDSINSFKN
jgi:hypothetical protein